MIQEGRFTLDSVKIRIPLKRVKILDESISDIVARVSTRTGEVLEEKQNTKASRDEKGVKTTFSIEQRATQFDTVQYLIILVNAKQLGSRYFEGITIDNVVQLHSYLIGLGVVQFSLKELMKGECTDIDFKKDFKASAEEMKEAFTVMQGHAVPSSDYDKGSKLFWKQDNKGLQFNKRETTKTATAPFLKIYSKTLDLLHKSNIFALSYFDTIPQNLWRVEFTIKNKKHLERSGVEGNTLADILSIPSDQLEKMHEKSLKAVLSKRVRESQASDEIPPKDIIMVNALILLLDSGMQWTIIKKNILGSLTSANRTKKEQKLDGYFRDYIRPIEGYSSHLNVDSILNQIGYNF